MASCNDCIHYEACKGQVQRIFWDSEYYYHGCKHFKDCDRFVELPCKVGDTIYEIKERKRNGEWKKVIVERIIQRFEIGKNGWMVAICGTTLSVFLCDLEKTVFLTKPEAEQALKKESDKNV